MKERGRKTFFLGVLLLISCNPEKPIDQNEKCSPKELKQQKAEDYDEHQFFEDLKPATLDELIDIIEKSNLIMAYNWNGNSGNPAIVNEYIIDAYGKLDDSAKKGITLTLQQKKQWIELLSDTTNYYGFTGDCFIPHVAFVYVSEEKVIGQSNVCFLCSGIKSTPKFEKGLSQNGLEKAKAFCSSIGLQIIDIHSTLSH